MQILTKIASRFIMFVTIASFAISTTGFTFYKHNCKHHEVQSSILSIDECCVENIEDTPEEAQSCCSAKATEKFKSNCGSEFQEGDCCVTKMSYVKLSETYVPSENELSYVDCVNVTIILNTDADDNVYSPEIPILEEKPDIQKLRPPLYRLYNRVKIDPPLI